MTALFAALGGVVLGSVATFVLTFVFWMKSEDRDLKQGYIEIAGDCYLLQPIERPWPLLRHGRQAPAAGG